MTVLFHTIKRTKPNYGAIYDQRRTHLPHRQPPCKRQSVSSVLLPLTMLSQPKLATLLTYQNDQIVRYYCKEHPAVSVEQGHLIFKDLLGWLWINAYRKQKNLKTHLFGPLLKLDAMWHVFILHTRIYTEFCQHFFSAYFHHDVEPHGEEHQLSADELTDFLGDCYDHLGEAWVVRNFESLVEVVQATAEH